MSADLQPGHVVDEASRSLMTLCARLALRGYELRKMEGGKLLVVRWGMSRELSDIEAAEVFARQVGAA